MGTLVQVVQHLVPGGIETMALDLMHFSKGHDKKIIISLEGNLETAISQWPRLKPVAEQLIFLDKKKGIRPSLILKLSRLFKALDVDVVHTHHIGPLLYAGIAARLARIKHLVHTEHDAWHLANFKRRKLQRQIIKLTHPLLVADANTVADNMKKFLKLKHVYVVKNGIDTKRFKPGDKVLAREQLGLPQNVPLIGCSGRLEVVKGHSSIISALAQLPENVHLTLAGTGSEETNLRCLVDALSLKSRVHFLGRVDEMPVFYQSLDVFCLPSLNEGLPLSPLEAQACDIPTAVTDVGGSSEALCPSSGILIPANDIDAMALWLHHLLQKPYKDARTFVQREGDVRHMASAYTELRLSTATGI